MRQPCGSKTWVERYFMAADLPQKSGFYKLLLDPGNARYAMSVPDGYDGSLSYPLILVLHWGGPEQPHRGEAILSGLALPALGSLRAIMVAPDCPDQDWTTRRSEKLILELLDDMQRAYSVDPHISLIVGYSMGAHGTWHMAAKHPGRFSAAIPISGTPPPGMVEVNWSIPMYVIHSSDDEHFPLSATQKVVEQMQARDADIVMRDIGGITHFDVAGFIKPLQAAVPWIKQIWSRQSFVDIDRI
jgi:predicted peptidase